MKKIDNNKKNTSFYVKASQIVTLHVRSLKATRKG